MAIDANTAAELSRISKKWLDVRFNKWLDVGSDPLMKHFEQAGRDAWWQAREHVRYLAEGDAYQLTPLTLKDYSS